MVETLIVMVGTVLILLVWLILYVAQFLERVEQTEDFDARETDRLD